MPSRREMWVQRIYETGSVGRYLLPGRDLEFMPALIDAGDDEVRDFLERLDTAGGSSELLASAYWLSQPEVEKFLFSDLPVLLRSLGHGSRASPPRIEPNFKGRVLWQETLMSRLAGVVPRGRYVVSHIEKSADIPENQLLKKFLQSVASVSSEMARRGTGSLPNRFNRVRDAASKALTNSYLKAVSVPPRITARMLNTARRHRDHRYSRLATLAKDFDAAVVRGKWCQIIELLRKGWLAPISSADLFELYSLILILDVLEIGFGFGRPTSYGLIQRGRSAVAIFNNTETGISAEVFFDQAPSGIFGSRSEYLSTVGSYSGVSAQERRPDIAIKFATVSTERRLIIEIKESEDANYMRDSVYKVLAYLRDFSDTWEHLQDQKPKAILMFPTGVTARAPSGGEKDIWLVSADQPSALKLAMGAAMGNMAEVGADDGLVSV